MTPFDLRNWYWAVATNQDHVFSSASGDYVSLSDADYQTWLAEHGVPTPIAGEDELLDVLQNAPGVVPRFKAGLIAYAAATRYAKEVGGITINSVKVATDRESQTMLAGAHIFAQQNPDVVIRWKSEDGFVDLDAATVRAVANAVGAHVQSCFAAEATVTAAISNGSVTTPEQVDAAFAEIA